MVKLTPQVVSILREYGHQRLGRIVSGPEATRYNQGFGIGDVVSTSPIFEAAAGGLFHSSGGRRKA